MRVSYYSAVARRVFTFSHARGLEQNAFNGRLSAFNVELLRIIPGHTGFAMNIPLVSTSVTLKKLASTFFLPIQLIELFYFPPNAATG
jgi:hypothetical protein